MAEVLAGTCASIQDDICGILSAVDHTEPLPLSQLAHLHPSDLHGLTRLAVDGVIGTTGLVEQLHATIAGVAPPLGRGRTRSRPGITRLVYRSIHSITGWVGGSADFAFGQILPHLSARASSPRREQLLASLNGVLGDHLEASANPLALPMRLRQHGQALRLDPEALTRQLPGHSGRLLIAIHGLCMNDLQWASADTAESLPEQLCRTRGLTPLYLNYNTGRRIADNGRELAELIETLVAAWPVAVEEIVLLGHSMGGLVARSACHFAAVDRYAWAGRLSKVIMLGSPHHGAPLERLGHQLDSLLMLSPYSAPFARIGQLRSAGIVDLRHGRLLEPAASSNNTPAATEEIFQAVAAIEHADYHVIAATTDPDPHSLRSRWIGDGLVPVASALGEHADPARCLPIPDAHRLVLPATTHLGMLHHPQARSRIEGWLS